MNSPATPSQVADAIRAGFPVDISDTVDKLLRDHIEIVYVNYLSAEKFWLSSGTSVSVQDRIYTGEYAGSKLKGTDRLVYDCVYSRSNNGYVREAAVKSLYSSANLPEWAMPYLYLTLSDYVVEISSIVEPREDIIAGFRKLQELNPQQHHLAQARATSYWNEYYRNKYHQSEYPAIKLLGVISP